MLTMENFDSQVPGDRTLLAGLSILCLVLFALALISALSGLAFTLHNIWELKARRDPRRCLQWMLMIAAAALGIASTAAMISHQTSHTPGASFVTACTCFMAMIIVTLYQVWESISHRLSVLLKLSHRQAARGTALGCAARPFPVACLPFLMHFVLLTHQLQKDPVSSVEEQMLELVGSAYFKGAVYLNIPVMAVLWLTIFLLDRFENNNRNDTYKLGVSVLLISCAAGWIISFPYHFTLSPLNSKNPQLGTVYGIVWIGTVIIIFLQAKYAYNHFNDVAEQRENNHVNPAEEGAGNTVADIELDEIPSSNGGA